MRKYVLFYESTDDVASKAPARFPAHCERCQEFHARARAASPATPRLITPAPRGRLLGE